MMWKKGRACRGRHCCCVHAVLTSNVPDNFPCTAEAASKPKPAAAPKAAAAPAAPIDKTAKKIVNAPVDARRHDEVPGPMK